MASPEDIFTGFQAINITINDRILEKCVELCTTYNIEAEDFVDQWLAYTASNLSGAPPSLDALDRMERKELQKQSRKVPIKTLKSVRTELPMETTPVRHNLQKDFKEYTPVIKETPIQEKPSQQFNERLDSQSVQCQFGKCDSDSFKQRSTDLPVVKLQNEQLRSSQYMYEKLLTKRESINAVTRWIVSDIVNYHKLEPTKGKLKDYFGEMTVCGRVYFENLGKGAQSILFEGLLEYYHGHMTELNANHLDKLSLFNGEVVVIKGNNIKDRFVAREIYSSAPLPPPETPVNIQETLQIVVAAGPFTFSDNLLYEPLEDLLKYVVEFKPNLLILMGPFVETSNTILETMNENYDTFFESIIEGIIERLKGTGVKTILIPSPRDVHGCAIFPSPTYKTRKHHENLICAPNPCILEVDGLVIAASSVDILSHIGKNEIHRNYQQHNSGEDVLRFISYLFNQRSLYPLHPPDLEVRVDYQLLEKHGMLENLPHLLFLPSDLKGFAKRVQDCVVVNPQKVIKGPLAGTFARVEVRPGTAPICGRVSCQILRV